MSFDHEQMKRAIHRSQHCQRNWDLSRPIPEQDMELLMTAVSECPSKQNIAYYGAHFITNREVIEMIHGCTDGFVTNHATGSSVTNPQVLANLVVAFEAADVKLEDKKDFRRNTETHRLATQNLSDEQRENLLRDRQMAVGIAAGYLNLIASLLGYATGCCLCFDGNRVRQILGADKGILLLMGVGFKNQDAGRRIHHVNRSFVFPTKRKQPIAIKRIP